jgi:acetyl esterase/lipase
MSAVGMGGVRRWAAMIVALAGVAAVTATAGAQGPTTLVRTDRGQVVVERGVPYGAPNDPARQLDVWRPVESAEGSPALILVHGGAWAGGTRAEEDARARLASSQGWTVFNVDYPTTAQLGTGGSAWPAEVDAVRSAVEWVVEHAPDHGVDRDHIALVGMSAGGHLAALAAADGTSGVRALAVWSAPTDLVALAPDGAGSPPGCVGSTACEKVWSMPLVADFLGCTPQQCPERYRSASPVEQVTRATPPTFIANATNEMVPMSQAQSLHDALERLGVDVHLRVVPGSAHASAYTPSAWNDMMPFLASRLGVPEPEPIDFPGRDHRALLLALAAAVLSIAVAIALAIAIARRRSHRGAGP